MLLIPCFPIHLIIFCICLIYISESEVAQSCPTLCDPWTVAQQAPPSMGFSRQEYWSGLPFPSPIHKVLHKCINLNLKNLLYVKQLSKYMDNLFFFFFGCTGSLLLFTGFLQLRWAGTTLYLQCMMGSSLQWLLFLWITRSRYRGFSGCSLWAQ